MDASLAFHPGMWLAAAGAVAFLVRGRLRPVLVLAAPLAALGLLWMVPEGHVVTGQFLGYETRPLHVDRLARVFATIFGIAAFAGALFALRQPSRLEVPAALVYGGAAIGAVLAGDLLTLFVCWEVMAIASMLVLWSAGPRAEAAARRYILIHLLGGVLLMAGIAGHIAATGSAAFQAMRPDNAAAILILAGFLVNAAAPPFTAWLPDAYPEASWSGMVFLSAFTTKAAVYVLLRGFPGAEILLYVGLYMVLHGIVFAILANDMRRLLAHSIVSQVGFMVAAAGIGTELAINGAAAHAFAHIAYKALLLMAAGAVMVQLGRERLGAVGGLARAMPFTTACALVGALSISAFPLTSGFVSKSMITSAAAGEHLAIAWLVLNAASAATFLYAGLRFPWLVFLRPGSAPGAADPPPTMRAAMALLAAVCLGLGFFPSVLYAMLPYAVDYAPYTAGHVVSQLQLLLAALLVFLAGMRWLRQPSAGATRDWDRLWRGPGARLAAAAAAGWGRLARGVAAGERGRAIAAAAQAALGPGSRLARSWSTRASALGLAVLLMLFLLLAYR